ncbi:MAG: hypothetical protein KJ623_01490 [Nanoarchaeota archaeon]|nr:hypothetical protein [Nanoarchaeota archaeon]MBU0963188.1 hypothetical protein [Nanoarchaeota archaeon]
MEKVQTGGLMEFDYPKGSMPPRDPKLEMEIEKGYEEHRKIKKRNNLIKILVILLILVIIVLYYILK